MVINVSEKPAASNVREDVGSTVALPVGSAVAFTVGSAVALPVESAVALPVGSIVTHPRKTPGSKICDTKTSKPSEKCFCTVWYMIPNVSGEPAAYSIRVQRRR
jgi:hypothetical protein